MGKNEDKVAIEKKQQEKLSYYVDCANCGKQVCIHGRDSICYFCKKSATKKEVIMQGGKATGEALAVPRRPKNRTHFWEYCDQNKEAIIADYHSMKLLDFLRRWHISSTSWSKLKIEWGVGYKRQERAKRPSAGSVENGLPPLPAFDKSWAPEVQVKWLDVWAALREKS